MKFYLMDALYGIRYKAPTVLVFTRTFTYSYISSIYIYRIHVSCLLSICHQLPQKHTEHEEGNITTSGLHQHTTNYTTSTATHHAATTQHNSAQQQQPPDYEVEEEAGLELPPPMKPIQEPHLMANGPPTFKKDLKENSTNMVSLNLNFNFQ